MSDKNFKVKNGLEIEGGTITINSLGHWVNSTQIANSTTYFLANSALLANVATFANTAEASNTALTANNSGYLGGTAANLFFQIANSATLSGNIAFTGANVVFNGFKISANLYINTTASRLANIDVNFSGTGIYSNATHLQISALDNPVIQANSLGTSILANNVVRIYSNSSLVVVKDAASGNAVTANATTLTLQGGNTNAVVANSTTTTLFGGNLAAVTVNSTSTTIRREKMASAVKETVNVVATATTGTFSYSVLDQAALYHTANAAGNWVINVCANSTLTLNNYMAIGDCLSFSFIATIGATGYFSSTLHIDGANQNTRWVSGWQPTLGYTNTVSVYSYTIVKTGSAAYTVLAAQQPYGIY